MGAKRLQLFNKPLVAALNVMNGRDLGRAVGNEAGNDKRRAATKVR